jgi:hypothetical protein
MKIEVCCQGSETQLSVLCKNKPYRVLCGSRNEGISASGRNFLSLYIFQI